VAVISEVGNREGTLFWTDKWLHGQSIADLAPSLFSIIPQRRRQQHTVQAALQNNAWVSDIQGTLTMGIIVEYIEIWDMLYELQLQPEIGDTHIWR
jgi:hypothetical protein